MVVRLTTPSSPSRISARLHGSLSGTASLIIFFLTLHSLTVRAWDLIFKTMFANPCLSRVIGQVSHLTIFFVLIINTKNLKLIKLVGGGSIINGASLSSF